MVAKLVLVFGLLCGVMLMQVGGAQTAALACSVAGPSMTQAVPAPVSNCRDCCAAIPCCLLSKKAADTPAQPGSNYPAARVGCPVRPCASTGNNTTHARRLSGAICEGWHTILLGFRFGCAWVLIFWSFSCSEIGGKLAQLLAHGLRFRFFGFGWRRLPQPFLLVPACVKLLFVGPGETHVRTMPWLSTAASLTATVEPFIVLGHIGG